MIGCIARAHDQDGSLTPEVILENLACKASAAMALRTLLAQDGATPESIDYVINSGGLINVNAEILHWPSEEALKKASEIFDTVLRVFEIAHDEGIPTYMAADRLAEDRIEAARSKKT